MCNFAALKRIYRNNLIISKMIIIPVKEGENIDRALKRFKRKFEKTGTVKELRRRQAFSRPSIVNREEKLHAIYIQQLKSQAENN